MQLIAAVILASCLITNLSELAETEKPEARFDLVGTVTFASERFGKLLTVETDSGAACIFNETRDPVLIPKPGDRIRARGRTDIGSNGMIRRNCKTIDILSSGQRPSPRDVTLAELSNGTYDNRLIRVRCTLRDIHVDEIDTGTLFLALADGNESVYLVCEHTPKNEKRFTSLIGAQLEVTGACCTFNGGLRICAGRHICISDPTAIRVVTTAEDDPFDMPGIGELSNFQPSRIACHGRCRAIGTVLAVWQHGERVLIKNHNGELTELKLAVPNPPPCGKVIEAVGLPASNLFRINLLRARWRPALGTPVAPQRPIETSARELLANADGTARFDASKYGQCVQLRGTIKAISTAESREDRIYLASDIFTVPLDVSAVPSIVKRLDLGCEAEVVGICIMESENWTPYTAFPQIHGMTLVLRTPDDMTVLSRPSWWTTQRLIVVLVLVLVALASIASWNLLLRQAVRRRERELKREIFARVESNSKVRERTRLAVELHDSLSQGLTGVSMEIDTAANLAGNPPAQAQHLAYASKSLKSCRNELKNCIWDLRNDALDVDDMNEAIRRTLAPFGTAVATNVRVNVSRKRVSDNTAHAILRIVRELVANAIRHGRASAVKIAGCLNDGIFYLSVRDNGCGFDPLHCPSIGEGHFGLQGIRERIKSYDGTLDITSRAASGTRVSITLRLPDETEQEIPS